MVPWLKPAAVSHHGFRVLWAPPHPKRLAHRAAKDPVRPCCLVIEAKRGRCTTAAEAWHTSEGALPVVWTLKALALSQGRPCHIIWYVANTSMSLCAAHLTITWWQVATDTRLWLHNALQETRGYLAQLIQAAVARSESEVRPWSVRLHDRDHSVSCVGLTSMLDPSHAILLCTLLVKLSACLSAARIALALSLWGTWPAFCNSCLAQDLTSLSGRWMCSCPASPTCSLRRRCAGPTGS